MTLEIHKLNVFYGRAQILFDVGIKVGQGEIVALLGRNGAGKSTTLKAVVGLAGERRGKILFDGHDIRALPAYRIARLGIGYVPEDRRIFSGLTVRENLETGRQTPRPEIHAWDESRLYALFSNLAELRHRPAGQISGGEQQMLSVARTLMGQPKMILLDEPSEGLAPLIVERLARAVLEMKRSGLGVLLSEQNLRFVQAIAERVYIMEQGRIRFEGTMAELERDPAIRRTYLAL